MFICEILQELKKLSETNAAVIAVKIGKDAAVFLNTLTEEYLTGYRPHPKDGGM